MKLINLNRAFFSLTNFHYSLLIEHDDAYRISQVFRDHFDLVSVQKSQHNSIKRIRNAVWFYCGISFYPVQQCSSLPHCLSLIIMMDKCHSIHGGGDAVHAHPHSTAPIYYSLILVHKRMKLIFMVVDCCRCSDVAAKIFPMCHIPVAVKFNTHTHAHRSAITTQHRAWWNFIMRARC